MESNVADLKITAKELERLLGVEVNEIFIGGVLGGTYRPSLFQHPKRLVSFCLTQLCVVVLIFIFTLPVGLLLIRNSPGSIQDLPTISLFLEITLGMTVGITIGWNLYMRVKINSHRMLARLLDEVDRYNEVIQAVDLMHQLESIEHPQLSLDDRRQILEVLNITRSSLMSGLMTEKILRENRGLLARRYELLANIENNLTALKTLDLNSQAREYAGFLSEAIQIGLSVHQEMQKINSSR